MHRSFSLKVVLLICIAIGIMGTTASWCAEPTPAGDPLQELLEISGANRQIELLRLQFMQGIEQGAQQRPAMPDKLLEEMKKIASAAFDPAVNQARFCEKLRARLAPEKIAQMLERCRTPLARKITQFEVESNQPDKAMEMMEFTAKGGLQSVPVKRLEIIERLNTRTRSMEIAVQILVRLQIGFLRAFNGGLPTDKKTTEAHLKEIEKQMLEQSRQLMSAQGLGPLVFTYQALSDEELEKYILFFSDDLGKEWVTVTNEGLLEIIDVSSADFGTRLAKTLPSAPPRP